jgi:hypothetical protein
LNIWLLLVVGEVVVLAELPATEAVAVAAGF